MLTMNDIIAPSRLCLERALSIYEKTLDSFHPSVAIALTNLGATWRNLGDSLKSKELFEKALTIQEQLYEPYHPSVSEIPNVCILRCLYTHTH